MTYAARHPEQVAGLVLLDSSSPEQFSRMPAFPSQYAIVLRRGYSLMPTLSRLGVGQMPATSHLPAADAAKVAAITSTPKYYRNQRDEIAVIPKVFAQAQTLTTLGERPLGVLTASATSTATEGWVGAQDQLAALSANSVHRNVTSTHPGLLEDVRPGAASVRGRGATGAGAMPEGAVNVGNAIKVEAVDAVADPRDRRSHLLGPH